MAKSKEDSLHPPADRDGQGVGRQQAVRREQLKVLFLRLSQQQLIERVAVDEQDIWRWRHQGKPGR